jgi:hypothetical protein
VHAAGRHGAAGDIAGYLLPRLNDTSAKVVTAALRCIRGQVLPPEVLDGLNAAGTARSQQTALSIRQHLGPWQRVHADLAAISSKDPALADNARADLLTWLQHDAPTTYSRPDASQATQIADLLQTSELTAQQRHELAFAAGLHPSSPAAP